MRVIPTYLHGIMDYIVGLALLFAPNLFGFAEMGGAVTGVPRTLGVLILLQALVTNYELGAVKMMSMRSHLTMDYIVGIFLAVSPWIFGFASAARNAWVPHVVVGIVILGLAAITQREPYYLSRPANARV